MTHAKFRREKRGTNRANKDEEEEAKQRDEVRADRKTSKRPQGKRFSLWTRSEGLLLEPRGLREETVPQPAGGAGSKEEERPRREREGRESIQDEGTRDG